MIASHAEYKHTDYHFARTQSRGLAALDWEHRSPAFKTWSNHIYACVAALLLGLLMLGWG